MGQVKQSVLSKLKIIQISNYYTTTQSLVYYFITKLSRIFKVETNQLRPITESKMQGRFKNNHYLIVGLGNYGFDNTRHSIGFKAVDALASRLNIKWENNSGFFGTTTMGHIRLTLFKPKALMNVNGRSVARIANQLSLKPGNIYLLHDELDRVPGKFHLKEGGSAGGHNGVLSCMEALGSKDMVRLRIGIGRPSTKALVVTYVLSGFPKEEMTLVDAAIHQGLDSILDHIMQRSSVTKASLEKTSTDSLDPSICKNDHSMVSQTNDLTKSEADRVTSENVRTKKSSVSSDTKCMDSEATPER